ncbi:MAG: deoxyribodipyrimidine photolyase [Rhizobiales bacterium]|mgnify:FL=1|nr:deoxyribodipyrimidine photolyase [Hyphomicrobiales bacterium]MBA68503.1 deoxyribodipyrimidine photolyase [Hyphomicrobiales bacterium]
MTNAAKSKETVLVWFREDFRTADNAALTEAAGHDAVVPLYIREMHPRTRKRGAARNWWLHQSLEDLAASLKRLGAPLILATGDPYVVLGDIARQSGATVIVWNDRPAGPDSETDRDLAERLLQDGLEVRTFPGALLHDPDKLQTGSGNFYKVFTPFWRALESSLQERDPLPAPGKLSPANTDLESESLSDWKLLPSGPDWAGGLRHTWTPGESGARERLDAFLSEGISGYAHKRDRPDGDHTSCLSPHLAAGEITPAQIFRAMRDNTGTGSNEDRAVFRKEIGWREFCWHLLAHRPKLDSENFDGRFDDFPWIADSGDLSAWKTGMTGYPIVDAGMRQLWQTGWMHNRVRMIVASFLTKHLLIHWSEGERWFWDTLVDADPANNPANWQWVAGCGADAAPYFRIFNPIIQGEKFDPEGAYVRTYVPEIADLPDKYIHHPWDAPEETLDEAGIELGRTYPKPIVDHKDARERALSAFSTIKEDA